MTGRLELYSALKVESNIFARYLETLGGREKISYNYDRKQ